MKLTIITGITGSGKTTLALEKHREYENSVIISCDSRQIYKNSYQSANIPDGDTRKFNDNLKAYYIDNVPHFLIDFVDPKNRYSLKDYIKDFNNVVLNLKKIENIILVGGTGMWVNAIYKQFELEEYIEDSKFQDIKKSFEKLTVSELKNILESKKSHKPLNNSDSSNKSRIVNILSKIEAGKRNMKTNKIKPVGFDSYEIIITKAGVYKADIEKRMRSRIDNGLILELERLYDKVGPERMRILGMQYSVFCDFKDGIINKKELFDLFVLKEIQYQKRQRTWNKKYFENI